MGPARMPRCSMRRLSDDDDAPPAYPAPPPAPPAPPALPGPPPAPASTACVSAARADVSRFVPLPPPSATRTLATLARSAASRAWLKDMAREAWLVT